MKWFGVRPKTPIKVNITLILASGKPNTRGLHIGILDIYIIEMQEFLLIILLYFMDLFGKLRLQYFGRHNNYQKQVKAGYYAPFVPLIYFISGY